MSWTPQVQSYLRGMEIMSSMRVIVADADAASRSQVCELLESQTNIEVIGSCGNTAEMISCTVALKPDLLFLDAGMSDSDPIEALSQLADDEIPAVVLAGTSEKFAMRAFEVRALDFLLKPLDSSRLLRAVDRVRSERLQLHDRAIAHQLLKVLAHAHNQPTPRIALKVAGRVVLLDQSQVDWIEADGNYVRVRAGSETYSLREGIGRIQRRLDPKIFVRIHRSIIVNVRRIRELQPCNSGEYMVVLKDGKELSCSRGYRSSLKSMITAQ
jgi:two-component system LytT family response regulator